MIDDRWFIVKAHECTVIVWRGCRALDTQDVVDLLCREFVQMERQERGLTRTPKSHDFIEDPLLPLNGSHFLPDFLWNLPPALCHHTGRIPTDSA